MEVPWRDADGNKIENDHLFNIIEDYVSQGGKVFIGADSMQYAKKCSFACVIALHNCEQKVSKYYYKRYTDNSGLNKDLKLKIINEVSFALQAARQLIEIMPSTPIEIHVDIGAGKRSKTRSMIDSIKGWVLGSGFECKIKPKSWASSSIADWHTK